MTWFCHRVKIYSINCPKPLTASRLKTLEEKNMQITPIPLPLEIDLETDEEYSEEVGKRRGRDPAE